MKRRYSVFLVACCVLCVVGVQFVHAQDGQLVWTQNLNNGGRVYAMVVDPVNQTTLYSAGLDSGVYKSTNAGVSWFAANNGLTYRAVQALAISGSNPNVLYAGTDQNGATNSGVYVTTNGGANWTFASAGITDVPGIQSIAVHPTNPNIAYAAVFDGVVANTTSGLYKTTNGGTNWIADTLGLGVNRRFLAVAINPLNANTIYAGTSFMTTPALPSRIYKSADGGASWTEASNGLPSLTTNQDPVRAFSISTVDTSRVLAALFLNDTAGGAFLTTNGGTLWVKKSNGIPVATTLLRSCVIRPGSNTEFYVGTDSKGLFRTVNGGENWTDFSGGPLTNTFTIRALVFRTLRDSTLYAGAATTTPTTARGVFEYSWPTHDLGVSALQRITSFDSPLGSPLAMDSPHQGNAITLVLDGSAALADTVRFRAITGNFGSIAETTYQVRWSVDGVVQGTLSNTHPLTIAGTDTFLFAWNAGTPGAHMARAWTLLATDADHSNDTASNSFTITPSGGGCDTLRNLGFIPAYPTSSFGHASAALGDTLYIVGGSATGTASNLVYTYCISTATWGTGRPLPALKTGGDLVACGGNLYYIGGGTVINTTATPDCYKYNPVTGWSSIANIPVPVTGNTAECWGDSIIFNAAGGWTTYLATIQVYRVATDSWFTATPLPAGRGRRTQAFGLQGNRMFVACGYSGVFRKDFLIGTIIRADSISWVVGPDVPIRPGATGVSRPGGTAVDGRFYVVCGETTPAPAIQDSIYMWDIAAGQWLPTVIRGRGTSAASNYWGVISSSIIGGNVKVWIPGGSLTGSSATPLWVIDACRTIAPPSPGWTTQTSGLTTALYTVKAVDRDVAWIGGAGGKVLRTTNNGANWTSVGGTATTGDLFCIDALNSQTALFTTTIPSTGGTTYLFRTIDGGTTWTQVYSLVNSLAFIDAVKMFDANNGIALGDPVGGRWMILRTSNGGVSWVRDTVNAPLQVGSEAGSNNGFTSLGASNMWFPANNTPKVYRTVNGGTTWASSALPFTDSFTAGIAFVNTQYGVAGGNAGSAARTTNGGATWTSVTIPGTGTIYGMSAAGTSDFFASKGGNVYRSTDLGATWNLSWTGTIGSTLWHLNFVTVGSNTRGYTVGGTGGIGAFYGTVTDVNDDGAKDIPQTFVLMQNYPNPFNPTTTLQYGLPRASHVTMKIYNVLGQEVVTLRDEVQSAGIHSTLWDGGSTFGTQVASGVYFYRIEAKPVDRSAPFVSIRKMLMLK